MRGWRPDRWARLHRATSLLVGDDRRLQTSHDEVRALLGGFEPVEVGEYWVEERVLVLAVERAASIGLVQGAWTEAATELRAYSARRAGLIDLVALRVTRTLEKSGIPAMLLKGPQLSERLYGSAATRAPSADIDVLVPTASLFDAHDLLTGLGWDRATDPLLKNGLPVHHLEMGGRKGTPNVELHWRVQWYDEVDHAVGLFERAERYRGLRVAEPVDLLGILLLCWARDGFRGLRLAADIATWWRTFGASDGPLTPRLWAAGRLQRPLTIGAQSAALVLGTPCPQGMLGDPSARLAERVAASDRPRGRRPGGSTVRGLVDLAVCPVDVRHERFFQSWALPREVSQAAHPWAPPLAVPLLQATSAARTAVESISIVARAIRLAPRTRGETP